MKEFCNLNCWIWDVFEEFLHWLDASNVNCSFEHPGQTWIISLSGSRQFFVKTSILVGHDHWIRMVMVSIHFNVFLSLATVYSLICVRSSMFKVMHLDWAIDRIDCRTELIHCSNDIWALNRSLSYIHYLCYRILYGGFYSRRSSYFSDHLVSSNREYKSR